MVPCFKVVLVILSIYHYPVPDTVDSFTRLDKPEQTTTAKDKGFSLLPLSILVLGVSLLESTACNCKYSRIAEHFEAKIGRLVSSAVLFDEAVKVGAPKNVSRPKEEAKSRNPHSDRSGAPQYAQSRSASYTLSFPGYLSCTVLSVRQGTLPFGEHVFPFSPSKYSHRSKAVPSSALVKKEIPPRTQHGK